MKVNANTIRVGNILEHDNKLWSVIKTTIVQPGKGGAFITIEMKDVKSGLKTVERFRTQETVERARLDEQEMQFLFAEDDTFTFMDNETFEQIVINREMLGTQADFLQDGMQVTVMSFEGTPLTIEIPAQVTMEVVECEPVVKGQTASSSYKPGLLENGVRILIPPHVDAGTRVVVATADASYVEKAKD